MGHVHENKATDVSLDSLVHKGRSGYEITLKPCHLMITGSFKEEYGKGEKGWHVERGAPPKPVGGRILDLTITRENNKIKKVIRSYKFPF